MIGQFDFNTGELICRHKNISVAHLATGLDRSNIGKCVNGRRSNVGGYVFSKDNYEVLPKEMMSDSLTKIVSEKRRKNATKNIEDRKYSGTKIFQYNANSGELLGEFKNPYECADIFGLKYEQIINCCFKRVKTYSGSIWSFEKHDMVTPYESYKKPSIVQIGEVFSNGLYDYIIEDLSYVSKSGTKYYRIKFIDGGYTTIKSYHMIISGRGIINFGKPTVCGVGIVNQENARKEKEYSTWKHMLNRCYNNSSTEYEWYGGKGVCVCDRWHTYTYFKEDIKNIQGYDREKFLNGELSLDKDVLQRSVDFKKYSPETCIWLSKEDNSIDSAFRQYISEFYAKNTYGEIEKIDNIIEFSNKHLFKPKDVYSYILGKSSPNNGWEFWKVVEN